MSRRRLLLGVGVVALVVGVVGLDFFLWLTSPTPGATLENFRCLRYGMSIRKVEALLGRNHVNEVGVWGWQGKDEDIAIYLSFETGQLTAGYVRSNDPSIDMERIHPDDGILQWLNSDAYALHRAYVIVAIAGGILALLLCVYCKRRLLLALGAVGLLGVAGFVLFIWPTRPAPTPGVTWENFHRLHYKMSPADVEALLGKPQKTVKLEDDWTKSFWRSKDVAIYLLFDRNLLRDGVASRPGQDGQPDAPICTVESAGVPSFSDQIIPVLSGGAIASLTAGGAVFMAAVVFRLFAPSAKPPTRQPLPG